MLSKMAANPGDYNPADPQLIANIVSQMKSKGIFDQFRKECVADMETKSTFKYLQRRVEGQVDSFLERKKWRPHLNKLQLREDLKKYIQENGCLDVGVERMVNQVVNPKMRSTYLPTIKDCIIDYLTTQATAAARPVHTTQGQPQQDAAVSKVLQSFTNFNLERKPKVHPGANTKAHRSKVPHYDAAASLVPRREATISSRLEPIAPGVAAKAVEKTTWHKEKTEEKGNETRGREETRTNTYKKRMTSSHRRCSADRKDYRRSPDWKDDRRYRERDRRRDYSERERTGTSRRRSKSRSDRSSSRGRNNPQRGLYYGPDKDTGRSSTDNTKERRSRRV